MRKIVLMFVILVPVILVQGCAVGILAAGVGAGIGMGRSGKAKIMEAKTKYSEQYNTYKLGMENINLEREKAGLQPQPIKDFDEWLDEQPLTADEIKLFKKYKVSTTKDLKNKEAVAAKTNFEGSGASNISK